MKYNLLIIVLLTFVLSSMTFAVDFDITIDGAKDAWYSTLTGPEDGYLKIPFDAINLGEPLDDADLSALIWMAWDTEYMYFYAEVSDEDIIVNNATLWENDGIELKMDVDTETTTGGVAAVRLTALGEDDAEVLEGVDNINTGGEINTDWEPVDGTDYARAETDVGYNLEFRIPWEHIARPGTDDYTIEPEVGNYFGLAIQVNDNDESSRTKIIMWAADMLGATYGTVEDHATATFLADHKFNLDATFNSAASGGEKSNDFDYTPPAQDPVGIAGKAKVVDEYALSQNYPNPFNPTTTISYSLKKAGFVNIEVYNMLGQLVETLVNEQKTAGIHTVQWHAASLNSGVYLFKMTAGEFTQMNKALLLK